MGPAAPDASKPDIRLISDCIEASLQRVRGRAWNLLWRGQRRVRDAVLARGAEDRKTNREDVAARVLSGDGIEIGALDFPMRVPAKARVRYVDYLDGPGLEAAYAEVLAEGKPLVHPDIVDDGARLGSIADASLDFVVANHMLEHVEDPLGALEHHLRVLRSGGVVFLTIPDARHTFDAARPLTTPEHLFRDHREGPEVSRRGHYEECAHIIEGHQGDAIAARADEMEAEDMRPHFHVWTPLTFGGFLAVSGLPCSLVLLEENGVEFLAVLRRES